MLALGVGRWDRCMETVKSLVVDCVLGWGVSYSVHLEGVAILSIDVSGQILGMTGQFVTEHSLWVIS